MLLSEFGALVQGDRIEVREELIDLVGVRQVELAFLECAHQIAGVAVGDGVERDDKLWAVFATSVES
ncbi:hypothetical protein Hbl1158_02710 [Halobaculum sp. CBA1158]|uniref:hypothetical protein n=1 Tax=Halobaculum sp. CBA1158 TaxID=2904243 RepID=UPI001F3F8414|nr:hypothetical protein [Halobaculum sp. CBA1158]UIP00299.1 hypothetical protein Hbl1158_02710 [Halobaculum sp. CBA1158]